MNRRRHLHRALATFAMSIATLHGAAAQATPACSGYGFALAPGSFGGGPGAGGTSSVQVGASPLTAVVGDFNGDRWPDIATANNASNDVTILLGNTNGDGNFTQAPGSPIATGAAGAWGIASGRFNGDAHLDLVVSHQISSSVSVLLGDGNGGFTTSAPVPVGPTPAGPQHLTTADFNADGRLDVAVSNGNNTISVFLGDGNGGLARADGSPFTQPGLSDPGGIVGGTFANGDLFADLAVISRNGDSVLVLRGTGTGQFTLEQTRTAVLGSDATPRTVELHDMNGDARPDLVVAAGVARQNGGEPLSPNNAVAIFHGQSGGGFEANARFVFAGPDLTSATAADMDRDGRLDIVASNGAFFFAGSVALQNETGFDPPTTHDAAGNPFDAVTGDFNDDGYTDFAVLNQSRGTLTVFLNTCSPLVFANGFEP